jgi:hypothetical protein
MAGRDDLLVPRVRRVGIQDEARVLGQFAAQWRATTWRGGQMLPDAATSWPSGFKFP